MANYKVPQDVEADDKLIGPFSFRQFVYLLIAGGLIALAVLFYQIFPLLAIIPVPPVILMLILALPIKKDQPMETYLAAMISYYVKPRTRKWTSGQSNTTIKITAPKIVEENRKRDISGEEATHRLSFLADIVDTEGYAIRGAVKNELAAEANETVDMFEGNRFNTIENAMQKDEEIRHREVIANMQKAIMMNNDTEQQKPTIEPIQVESIAGQAEPIIEQQEDISSLAETILPEPNIEFSTDIDIPDPTIKMPDQKTTSTTTQKSSIIDLANNTDYSVATIAKEAKRMNRKDDGEVFISLH